MPGFGCTSCISPDVASIVDKRSDVPVIVAIAFCRRDGELLAVGRPIEFVDVGIGWRKLAKLRGGNIHEGEALLKKIFGNDAFIRRLGDEWPGGAGSVFGEQERDRFRIGRPAGAGEKSFHVRELLGGAGFLFRGGLVRRRTLRHLRA